ncbi:MAG: hypothetical protein KME50_28450, partial [Nostoc desertorum CM1-VF14]|nr:hypothetical protein [Nostoc desertorum CM1-VF14]
LTTVMQGFWAILPSFLAPEYTSRVFLSTDCHLFFLFQQALSIGSEKIMFLLVFLIHLGAN